MHMQIHTGTYSQTQTHTLAHTHAQTHKLSSVSFLIPSMFTPLITDLSPGTAAPTSLSTAALLIHSGRRC